MQHESDAQRSRSDTALAEESKAAARARTVARFHEFGIKLPTFAQLSDPAKQIPGAILQALESVDPDTAHPLNLFRMHWHNSADRRGIEATPGHIVLPESLTGVKAPIIVCLGERFPMITAHKVLAAYSCLVPRLVTGEFDPTKNKAVWPSTGNYCRGGVAISKILGCQAVAVLPEEMSAERFEWLDRWGCTVVKTPGGEANVKEIYDKCAELSAESPHNVILNQFKEFGNALGHYACTGPALSRAFEAEAAKRGEAGLELFAFTSATGSAGTIAAGDRLKEDHGARICAVESVECPTLLRNGFGEHNIQGIGDKHLPYIHNVYNTDFVAGISDAATDKLAFAFNHPEGQKYLRERRGVPADVVDALSSFGYSAIANVLAAIKLAKYHKLDATQAIVTVATDGYAMYRSEAPKLLETRFGGRFDQVSAAECLGEHLYGQSPADFQELTQQDRERIFNLGYFTWVEQRGVTVPEFNARRSPKFWKALRGSVGEWDKEIEKFNADVAALDAPDVC